MPLDPQINEKLAIALSGDTELYDQITNYVVTQDNDINTERESAQTWQQKLQESEERNKQYTGQIAHLVNKLPMGTTNRPESYEEKKQAIRDRSWSK